MFTQLTALPWTYGIFIFSLCKTASTWLCHHHKGGQPPWSPFRSLMVGGLWLGSPCEGSVGLAARLILVSWREAELSRWPPRWVDGSGESEVKRGWKVLWLQKRACVCGGGDGGIFFTANPPATELKLGTACAKEKEEMPAIPSRKIKNTFFYFSIIYSVHIRFRSFMSVLIGPCASDQGRLMTLKRSRPAAFLWCCRRPGTMQTVFWQSPLLRSAQLCGGLEGSGREWGGGGGSKMAASSLLLVPV